MTAPAIASVIKKPDQYLRKFITLMREGADVPFTDEQVASMRIYKDGANVKRILEIYDDLVQFGLDIYDKDILDDLFRKLPPGAMETKDVGRYHFKDIEYQSIADPKKIELLSLNKIGKQIVSGRGGGDVKFEGRESDWTETLTCYALAFRQDKGSNITEEEFKEFLIKGRNKDPKVVQVINQNVLTNKDSEKVYMYGLSPSKSAWLTSGTKVANALYASPYLKSGVNYNFVFGGDDSIKWFKSKWYNKFNYTLQNYLKRMNNITNDTKYGSSVDDKWNPADIYAISKQTKEQKAEMKSTTMGFFAGDWKEWKKLSGKNALPASDQKVQEDIQELSRYNNWIHQRILDGTLIPISLKKVLGTPKVKLISNPSIEEFHVEIKNIKVDWAVTAAKIYIHFDVTYTTKVGGAKVRTKHTYSYFFDCRNFNTGDNVQFELGMSKSSAKHGKISVGPAEMIIDMTSSSIKNILKQRRKNYTRYMLKQNPSNEALKIFDTKVANKSRLFIDNQDIDAVCEKAGWPLVLTEYMKFISKESGYDLSKFKSKENDFKNYFKSKLASVELGWVMTAKQIQPMIRNSVLKSLYLYASSQGLRIFDDSGLLKTSYFENSSYVKVFD
jgi:hypothetical protein